MADETADGCLQSSRRKTAGATIYLMEELGDARLRCDQLLRYIDEAVKLIEKSSHRDHFFEVAGHLIQNVPEVAFKLQKALQAVALAADRLDYEEIKQELRPEKVEELERVLKEVRIRPVQRRSFPPAPGAPGVPMNSKQAADRLRQIARTAREEGSLPLADMAALVRDLDPGRKASGSEPVADTLDKLASMLETSKEPVSRVQLATLLSRMGMESEFNRALRVAGKPKMTQQILQLGNADEVKKKFKEQNPDISDDELNEIAKQWQANKDVVKDKSAADDAQLMNVFTTIKELGIDATRASASGRWRAAVLDLFYIVDEIGTVLVHLGSTDTSKTEALKRQIYTLLPKANRRVEELTTVMANDDDKRSRFEEGKPADPTKQMDEDDASKWKENTEEYGDKFKAASKKVPPPGPNVISEIMAWHGGQGTNLYLVGSNWYAGRSVDEEEAKDAYDELKRLKAARGVLREFKEHLQDEGVKVASEGRVAAKGDPVWIKARYPGKDDDGKPFKKGDDVLYWPSSKKFQTGAKADAAWKKFEAEIADEAFSERNATDDDKRSRFEEGKPADPTKNMDEDDASKWKENTDEYGDKFKAATDDDKRSKFEEGKPADPTKNMDEDDAAEWKSNTDQYGDKFKAASGLTTHLEGKKGHTLCGEKSYSDTLVKSVKDASCYYCKLAWEKKHSKAASDLVWKVAS